MHHYPIKRICTLTRAKTFYYKHNTSVAAEIAPSLIEKDSIFRLDEKVEPWTEEGTGALMFWN